MFNPFQYFHSDSLKHLNEHIASLVKGKLWFKIIIGMLLGLLAGAVLSPPTGLVDKMTAETIGSWLALPGHIFLTLIQMIVIPLIIASIIRGIAASGSMENLSQMGVKLVAYFLMTTVIAVSIGVAVTILIQPGSYVDTSAFAQEFSQIEINKQEVESKSIRLSELPGAFISVLPDNPLNNMLEMQMLQIVIFAVIVGLALVSLPQEKGRPLLNWINSVQAVCMTIVRWTMYLAPLAVFGLLAQITIKTGFASFFGIAYYIGTVVFGLGCMMLVYLLIAFIAGGYRPWQYLGHIREAQLLAFSTDSSVVTMPLSIKIAEEKLGIKQSVANFIIPIGATLNMDGTALYQGVATIFLAQIFGIELGLGAILVLILTAVGASIGTPATPGVGIVVLSTVLTSIGIPVAGIALIIGVDRILEMLRTATNVTGDLTASVVMDRLTKPQTVPEALTA
jgi:Na+/H+-dicarboxylate symporter